MNLPGRMSAEIEEVLPAIQRDLIKSSFETPRSQITLLWRFEDRAVPLSLEEVSGKHKGRKDGECPE